MTIVVHQRPLAETRVRPWPPDSQFAFRGSVGLGETALEGAKKKSGARRRTIQRPRRWTNGSMARTE